MSPSLLSNLFAGCFWFGTAATVLSFVFGLGHHGSLHLPHFGHVGGHLGSSGHAGEPSAGVSPFNLTSILAFVVIFGAVGLALQGGVGGVIALVLAALAGVVAGWLAFVFIARFLVRGETYLADEPMVGTVGAVSIPIGTGHVGEIMYTRHGVRRSDGARSIDGQPIAAGEQVVIVSYDNGLATVQRWHDFFAVKPR
ncbi:MAG TPA: hypothetical protein VNL16_08760 [Chloroflexota bacterium]|nr:hypothetical protein [Chloroflexota bacterium]